MKTNKGWRVGDRIAWCEYFGAVILKVLDNGNDCRLRFDDGSEGVHPVHGLLHWRRLRSKKITFKEKSK